MEKWPIFDQKHGLTPFEKCKLLETCCFYNLESRFYLLEYCNRFSWCILPKLKDGKIANFLPKPGSNPFGKMSFVDFLDLLRKPFFSF